MLTGRLIVAAPMTCAVTDPRPVAFAESIPVIVMPCSSADRLFRLKNIPVSSTANVTIRRYPMWSFVSFAIFFRVMRMPRT